VESAHIIIRHKFGRGFYWFFSHTILSRPFNHSMLKPVKIKYGKKRLLKTSSNVAAKSSSLFDSICDKENTSNIPIKPLHKKQLLEKQIDACCLLQSRLRLKNTGRRDRSIFLLKKRCCLLIQRFWRGFQVYLNSLIPVKTRTILYNRVKNATILQIWFRGKRERIRYLEKRTSCITIQRIFRGYLVFTPIPLIKIDANDTCRKQLLFRTRS
jgi:hypothetical protein